MYDPGEERTGLVGGTGGPWVGCGTGALMARRMIKHYMTVFGEEALLMLLAFLIIGV